MPGGNETSEPFDKPFTHPNEETMGLLGRFPGVGRARTRYRASARALRAASWWTATPARRLKDLDRTRSLPASAVALTFDDGPDPVVTPMLLDVLQKHQLHATFFMCGLAAQRHPHLVRAVAANGHSIGGHSWDHRYSLVRKLAPREWKRQIDDTHNLLSDLSGSRIRWFRPPWGVTDRFTWTKLRQRQVATVFWSVDGRDWIMRDPDHIASTICDGLEPGSIVLLHDAIADFIYADRRPDSGGRGDQRCVINATETIARFMRDRALEPVPLDQLPPNIATRRRMLRFVVS